eukprot:scaffold49394_cov22-Tisochrysis_lutea.AAC.2
MMVGAVPCLHGTDALHLTLPTSIYRVACVAHLCCVIAHGSAFLYEAGVLRLTFYCFDGAVVRQEKDFVQQPGGMLRRVPVIVGATGGSKKPKVRVCPLKLCACKGVDVHIDVQGCLQGSFLTQEIWG